MNRKNGYLCAVILHTALFITECIAFYPSPFSAELRYYTQLSNLLELFVSLVFLIDAAIRLKKGPARPSRPVRVLSYTAACMLTVTFLVVLFILSPMQGMGGLKYLMTAESMLWMHFICPVLALVSFLFFEKDPPLTKQHLFIAMLPTLLYAAVTITLNILRVMHGPYPFLYVYEQPLYMSLFWAAAVIGGAFVIAWGLKKINSAF